MQTEGRVSDSEISAAISSLSWSPSRPNDSVLQNGMRKPIKGFVASPNEAFWKIFKQSKTQLRALGIHLIKLDGGSWRVFSKTKVDDIPEKLGGVSLSRSTGSDIDIPKPEGMDYLPFQKAGIEYSITHTNVLYGDEMGLGKTIQAIGAINLDRSIHRVLVVVPAYLKINWQREINRWYVIRPSRTFIVNAGDDFPVPERSIDKTDFIIINYDILPRYTKNISSFDACILDECFHYDTLIETDLGPTKIGDVVCNNMGSYALSQNTSTGKIEWKRIVRRLRNKVSFDILRVTHEYGTFICTTSHKIYSNQKGYTEARLLCRGDALRVLWRKGKLGSAQAEVLQPKMLGGLEVFPAGVPKVLEGKKICDACLLAGKEKAGHLEEDEGKQSFVQGGCEAEDCGISQKESKDIPISRREWKADGATEDASGKIERPHGVCDQSVGSEGCIPKLAKPLQGGHCNTGCEACGGSGWTIPQDKALEVLGQTEDYRIELSRVVGIEVLERGDHGGLGCCDKQDYFYDLEVEGNHNYFANSILVSNCHYIKGKGTKRSDAVMSLKTKVKRWFALSGTPALNRPIELFNVANLLAPDKFPNYFNYAKRYCGGMNTGWGFEAKGCTHPEELQLKLRASILVRRLKNEVLKELPPKRRQIIELPALPSVQMLLDEEKRVWRLHEDTIAALRERRAMAELNDNDAEYMEAGKMIAREFSVSFAEMALLRKKLADHKVPLVHSQILDCADSGVNKMIVFFHHKAPIRTLHGMLEREGMHPLIVTGDIDPKARQDAVDDFQTKDKHKVILGSIGAMGTGVTLTESSHVIFGELDWRPGILSQAEDRAHRIGQMNNVLIQYLLFADSLDAKMISSVIEKMEVLKSVLDDNDYDEDDDMPFDEEATKKKKPPLKGINDEKERELIHEAIRILANFDPDLARGRNNAGFNKFDSFIGHRLSQEHSLTPRAAAIGKRIIKKYRRQLEGLWDQIFPLGVD